MLPGMKLRLPSAARASVTKLRPSSTAPAALSAKANVAAAALLRTVPNTLLRATSRLRNADGHMIDPDVGTSLAALRVVAKDFVDLPLDEGRALIDDEGALAAGIPVPVGSVRELALSMGMRARVYRPDQADGVGPLPPLPTLVYLHGGGWVLGSLDSHDATARFFANRGGVCVVALDYPLAPENPFPAGLDAIVDAYRAIANGDIEGVDTKRVALGGDSAGGNLTVATCMRLAELGEPLPVMQVLLVPVTNVAHRNTASYSEFASGFFLTRAQMGWYSEHYLQGHDPADPLVSPLLASDDALRGLPPTWVTVAGFDPLRDEGEAFAHRLDSLGVPVTLRRLPGMAHPVANSAYVWKNAERALDEIAGALRFALRVV